MSKVSFVCFGADKKNTHMFLSILFLYEIVELYIFVFASCIKSGGHIRQFEINFPIKDEEEIVRNMMSALDEHPNIRIAVLGIFSVFEIMPFIYYRNILMSA